VASYYTRFRGNVLGPFDAAALREMRKRGQFSVLHEVSADGQRTWRSASAFPELADQPAPTPAAANDPPLAFTGTGQPAALEWYYIDRGQQLGPVSADALRALARSGSVTAKTPVFRNGMADWTTLRAAGLGATSAGRDRGALAAKAAVWLVAAAHAAAAWAFALP
jgi:hypothetical protein